MNFLLRRFLSLALSLLPIALRQALDFAALKKKAEDGDRVAQFQVGMIYDSGKEGVEETVKSGSWDLKILNSENAAMLRYAFEVLKSADIHKDSDAAILWYRKASKQDLLLAQVALGRLCGKQAGMEKDEALAGEAYRWLMKAAVRGDPAAFNGLGVLYMNGLGVPFDLAKAKEWLQKSADKGYVPGQANLGQWYCMGPGVAAGNIHSLDMLNKSAKLPEKQEPADYAEGYKWIRLAADQGLEDAQTNLVMFYLNGIGVEKNLEKAVFWAKKLAKSGEAFAQLNFGFMYLNGTGVKQDHTKGYEWVKKSAKQNFERAQLVLGELYERGVGVKEDAKAAAEWYLKAAKQGNATGQFRVFINYVDGRGVEKDEAEAAKWCAKAAEKGLLNAERSMGYLLFDGTGVEKNLSESMVWFQKAAAKGDPDSQFMLGAGLFLGNGIEQDYVEAFKWLTLASEHVVDARNALSDLNGKITPAQMAEGLKRVKALKQKQEQGNKAQPI